MTRRVGENVYAYYVQDQYSNQATAESDNYALNNSPRNAEHNISSEECSSAYRTENTGENLAGGQYGQEDSRGVGLREGQLRLVTKLSEEIPTTDTCSVDHVRPEVPKTGLLQKLHLVSKPPETYGPVKYETLKKLPKTLVDNQIPSDKAVKEKQMKKYNNLPRITPTKYKGAAPAEPEVNENWQTVNVCHQKSRSPCINNAVDYEPLKSRSPSLKVNCNYDEVIEKICDSCQPCEMKKCEPKRPKPVKPCKKKLEDKYEPPQVICKQPCKYSDEDVCDPCQTCVVDKEIKCKKKRTPKVRKEKKVGTAWITSIMADRYFEDKYLSATLREFLLYLFFLTAVLIVAFGTLERSIYYHGYAMSQALINSEFYIEKGITKTFYNVGTPLDAWRFADYFLNVLNIQNIYKPPNDTEESLPQDTYLLGNYLIGVPRIRQVRVRNNSCLIPREFHNLFTSCYDYYGRKSEDKEPFGLLEEPAWIYSDSSQLESISYCGKISKYFGGGYSVNLDRNYNVSREILEELMKNTWIDTATRAVFLDFATYSPNSNHFLISKLVLEFPPTGGVIPSANLWSLKLIRYVTFFDYFILGLEIFIIMAILYYIVERLREFFFFGCKYFLIWWGIIELLIIAFAITTIVLGILLYIQIHQNLPMLIEGSIEIENFHPNFDQLRADQIIFNEFVAITVFLIAIKIFKFLPIFESFYYLSSTLSKSAVYLLSHIIITVLLLFAFAMFGYLAFGTQIEEFNSLWWSFHSMFIMIIGSFNYVQLYKHHIIMGPLFVFLFVILTLFIYLNFFVAIIVQAYAEAKCEKRCCTRIFICDAMRTILGRMRKKPCGKKRKCTETQEELPPCVNNDYDICSAGMQSVNVSRMLQEIGDLELDEKESPTAFEEKRNECHMNLIKKKIDCLDRTVDQLLVKMNVVIQKIMVDESNPYIH